MIGLRKALKRRLLNNVSRQHSDQNVIEEPSLGIEDWEPVDPSLWDWNSWKLSNEFMEALKENNLDQSIEWIGDDIARISIFDQQLFERIDKELEHLEMW